MTDDARELRPTHTGWDWSSDVGAAFHRFVEKEGTDIALPGSGRTWQRFDALASCGAADLSVARLVEGHLDALAILSEADRAGRYPGATYGVWAARSRPGGTTAVSVPGGWELHGSKPFCSGGRLIDRALVTAEADDGYRLFDIAVDEHVAGAEPGSWAAVGMADSASETLAFNGPVIMPPDAVGGPDFYTERPGFWFGAVGVAACWYGGAVGLVEHLLTGVGGQPGDHFLAGIGLAVSRIDAMRAVLVDAARAIDDDPHDDAHEAKRRAFSTRQIVHDLATEVLSATASAGGARPLCHDRGQARRAADLYVYLAQHHGAADAAELGREALRSWSWSS